MPPPFRFDLARARTDIGDSGGSIWPVNAFSDADELNSLLEAAQDSGVIARDDKRATILIYPLSLSEPDLVPAVTRPRGPALLGQALRLCEREGESPLDFTLRLLGEITIEANLLFHCAAASDGLR